MNSIFHSAGLSHTTLLQCVSVIGQFHFFVYFIPRDHYHFTLVDATVPTLRCNFCINENLYQLQSLYLQLLFGTIEQLLTRCIRDLLANTSCCKYT